MFMYLAICSGCSEEILATMVSLHLPNKPPFVESHQIHAANLCRCYGLEFFDDMFIKKLQSEASTSSHSRSMLWRCYKIVLFLT